MTASDDWFLLRSGAGSAAANMAVDEALLLYARELGKPVLRLYSWSEPAASFGYFQHYEEVAKSTSLRPLMRRPTGGGIVPHDRDWTYSVTIPPENFWYGLKAVESYRRVHEWIQGAFNEVGVAAELASAPRREIPGQCFAGAEQFDVLARNRKIAGAAQRRTRDGLLIQGSVQPPAKIDRGIWEDALCRWAERHWDSKWVSWELPRAIRERVLTLEREKYSAAAYNQRR